MLLRFVAPTALMLIASASFNDGRAAEENSLMSKPCKSVTIVQTDSNGKTNVVTKHNCGPLYIDQSTGNNRAVVIQDGKAPPPDEFFKFLGGEQSTE